MRRGFTLIELLVVVAIIGLLSSVVLSSLNSARTKARDAQRLQEIHQIELAIHLYESANGATPTVALGGYTETAYPDGSAVGLSVKLAPYMPKVPNDPLWAITPRPYFYYVANWDAATIAARSWSNLTSDCANKEVLVVRVMETTGKTYRQDCALSIANAVSIVIQ